MVNKKSFYFYFQNKSINQANNETINTDSTNWQIVYLCSIRFHSLASKLATMRAVFAQFSSESVVTCTLLSFR